MSEHPAASSRSIEKSVAFGPTSGKFAGWFGVVVAISLALESLRGGVEGRDVSVILGCLLAAAICWAVMLRPRVVLHPSAVELRNFVRDWHIGYGRISGVDVKTVTIVWVGERKYLGVGVGRKVKSIIRASMPLKESGPTIKEHVGGVTASGNIHGDNTGAYVAERIRQARDIAVKDEGDVRLSYAWIEIAVMAILAVAFVVSLTV